MNPAEGSTVIGKSVVIKGEVTGSEDLYMDGTLEGTITLSGSRLTVGPNAQVTASIHVQDLIVFGRVDGNIQATGSVDLRQSGSVIGDVLAGRLAVEDSALIKGRVELNPTGASKA